MQHYPRAASRRVSTLSASSLAVLAALAVLAPQQLLAQETGAQNGQDADIIVTARRRDENLSRVPAAITAFNAEQMIQRSIRTDSDLQLTAPGLTIRQTQGNNTLTYAIRGQTADTFSGTPSAVIAYMNEVPMSVGSASSFYDLDSIQVLKGPQGTLFGRNATGGAVLYTSAKPTDKVEAMVRGRAGNLALREAEGMLNVPFADGKILFRAAFDVIRRGGYILNTYNGEYLGQLERNSGRVSLTLKPTDSFTNNTTFQYTGIDGTNTGASYTWSVYGDGASCPTNNGFALNCNAAYAYGPGLANYPETQRALGLYKTNHPGGARHHGTDWLVTNTSTLDINDDLTIKNIFGASRSATNSVQPQLGAPYVTIATYNAATGQMGNSLKVKSISDELQLQGKAFDNKLDYIVGAYFQRQTTDTIWPQSYFLTTPYAPGDPLQPACGCLTNAFRVKNTSKAVYAQGTYDLSGVVENLKFTAGMRYTWEDFHFSQINVPGNYSAAAADEATKFSDPSWEAGLEYQATPELLTYAKTRGSFRSGGFNGAAAPVFGPATSGGNVFNSEHTQDIEIGAKYRGHLFGRPATLNLDAFNQWVQNVQRVEFPPGGAVTVNVPAQIVQGVEGEFSIRATDWLELGAQAAYVNARYTNGNVVLNSVPYLYGPVADTPKFTGAAYSQINFPPSDLGELSLRVDVYGQTGQYFSNASSSRVPNTRLPGYALVNARLSWDHIMKSNFSGAIFGKNLGNRGYFVGGMPLGAALGHNAAAVGEPITGGIELTWRY